MAENIKKTTLETKIVTLLVGETQKNALDLMTFLNENKIPSKFYVINVVGEGGSFPHIRPWAFFFNACDFGADVSANNDLAEFAWKHAHICDHFINGGKRCGCGKQPGFRNVIFGNEFDNLCKYPMQFINPDTATLDNMKNLLSLLKERHAKK